MSRHTALFAQPLLKHNGQGWLCAGRRSPPAAPRPPPTLALQGYSATSCVSVSAPAPAGACSRCPCSAAEEEGSHSFRDSTTRLIAPQLTHSVTGGTNIQIKLIILVVCHNQAQTSDSIVQWGFVGLGEDNSDLADVQTEDTFSFNTVLKARSDGNVVYLQARCQLSCGRTKQRAEA